MSSEARELLIKLPSPHAQQQSFIDSSAKRKIVRAGRRGGKTVGVAIYAVNRFLAGKRVLYGAPTADQLQRFWYEVTNALRAPLEAKIFDKNESFHTITLPHTEQRIRAKTCWNADTLRGDFADELILDEWQLMNEDAWEVVGAPMLLDNDGNATFIYTPPSIRDAGVTKAHDSMHAAKMFKKAKADDSGRWATFHFSSLDNPYLSKSALAEITKDITQRVYQQEILAIDQDDNPLALWNRGMIEPYRMTQIPALTRIVVALDPSASSMGAECGIVAAGVGPCRCKGQLEPHGFLLDDKSLQASPEGWAGEAVALYNKLTADSMIAEQNNGGEMVRTTISTVPGAPFVRLVHASRGKITRAEPIAAMYERGWIHHVGTFGLLEDELCGYDGSSGQDSPNRYDALVWAFTAMLQDIRAGKPALTPEERTQQQMQSYGWTPDRIAATAADPMAWFSRELHEARLRNSINLERKYGQGQWDELEDRQEQREWGQGLGSPFGSPLGQLWEE